MSNQTYILSEIELQYNSKIPAIKKPKIISAEQSLENGERMHSEGALKMMLGLFNGH